MWQTRVDCVRFEGDKSRRTQEYLGMELELRLVLNEELIHTFSMTPGFEQELVLGYLFSNGYLTDVKDVVSIELDDVAMHVRLSQDPVSPLVFPQKNHKLSRQALTQMMSVFQEKAMLYKDTSIGHSAALASHNGIAYFAEDLSRLNAWNKVIGQWLVAGKPDLGIVIISGKIDLSFVTLLVSMNISYIVSRLGPTLNAVNFASENDLVVVGFARGSRFNLYSGQLQ